MTRTESEQLFSRAVADAAEAIAETLGAHPPRGNQPYPISEVLPVLVRSHLALQQALEQHPGSVAVTAEGKENPLGGELAGLMSYLQLLSVLYRGLDEFPDWMKVNASRNLSAVSLAARRVRDRARRLMR
ncbi:hypothetical protein [Lentzea jiangxiensis]|uniref:Uncharacterized protein n=1 Tax=Lentzea jiangxiensis TaxID=641025 RepID=A0A1H0WUL3_9PSEU|nr:hypothetical protein [Lentzea jiangxiensis]SDP94299.1 hypothetical protein SAMN05421507_12369 [Lentzea jiangxiensis]